MSFVAFRTPHISFRKIGDLSYGTYIYAFPVQQAIIATTHTASRLTVLVLATPITLTSCVRVVATNRTARAAPKAPSARAGDGRSHIRNSRTRRSEVGTQARTRRGIIRSSNVDSVRSPSAHRATLPES